MAAISAKRTSMMWEAAGMNILKLYSGFARMP